MVYFCFSSSKALTSRSKKAGQRVVTPGHSSIFCTMVCVILVSIPPRSSGNWFWHLGGALNFKNIANTIDTIDIIAAVRNIRLYASAVGKECCVVPIFITYWYDCMYIAARAGPMELPIIRIRLAMPSDIPLFCLGVFRTIVF